MEGGNSIGPASTVSLLVWAISLKYIGRDINTYIHTYMIVLRAHSRVMVQCSRNNCQRHFP